MSDFDRTGFPKNRGPPRLATLTFHTCMEMATLGSYEARTTKRGVSPTQWIITLHAPNARSPREALHKQNFHWGRWARELILTRVDIVKYSVIHM